MSIWNVIQESYTSWVTQQWHFFSNPSSFQKCTTNYDEKVGIYFRTYTDQLTKNQFLVPTFS